MSPCLRADLLHAVEDYLRITNTSPVILGLAAVNDPACIPALRHGGTLDEATAHALLDHVISDLEAITAPAFLTFMPAQAAA